MAISEKIKHESITHSHHGSCHCQKVKVLFETMIPVEQWSVRQCGCTFCKKHNPYYVSDSTGRFSIMVEDPNMLNHYQFGLKTADFISCKRCGVFVAAVLTQDDALLSVININVFDETVPLQGLDISVSDWDAEVLANRIDRRKKYWTPTTIVC